MYDDTTGLYRVRYEDDDVEEYPVHEVSDLVVAVDTDTFKKMMIPKEYENFFVALDIPHDNCIVGNTAKSVDGTNGASPTSSYSAKILNLKTNEADDESMTASSFRILRDILTAASNPTSISGGFNEISVDSEGSGMSLRKSQTIGTRKRLDVGEERQLNSLNEQQNEGNSEYLSVQKYPNQTRVRKVSFFTYPFEMYRLIPELIQRPLCIVSFHNGNHIYQQSIFLANVVALTVSYLILLEIPNLMRFYSIMTSSNFSANKNFGKYLIQDQGFHH